MSLFRVQQVAEGRGASVHWYAALIHLDPMEDLHEFFMAVNVFKSYQDNVSLGEVGYCHDGSLAKAWMTVGEEDKGLGDTALCAPELIVTKGNDPIHYNIC